MQKPIITLKNIKFNETLSDETNCYSATLYVDGVKWGVVGNEGHGGEDNIYEYASGKTRADFEALDALIAATYPTDDTYGITIESSLEILCGEELNKHLLIKDYRRLIKSKVVYLENNSIYTCKLAPHTLEKWIAHLSTKKPDAKVLNTMPEEEAIILFKASAA